MSVSSIRCKLAFTYSEDLNQPVYPYSLIRVLVFRIKKRGTLGYPWIAYQRLLSDCANAQTDLNLRLTHMQISKVKSGNFGH